MFGLRVLIFFSELRGGGGGGGGRGLKRESSNLFHIAARQYLNQRVLNCCECFALEFVFVLF